MKDNLDKLITRLKQQLANEESTMNYHIKYCNTDLVTFYSGKIYILKDVIAELEKLNESS